MTSIVSFDDLKKILDLEKSSISDYPQLALIADSVHDSLEDFTGQSLGFIAKKIESGFNSSLKNTIDLTNLPITSVISVELDGVGVTSYTIMAYGLELSSSFTGQWAVTTKGGYKVIPKDIYRAELMQIVYEYQNIDNVGTTSFGNDGGSVQTEGFFILKDVQRLLKKYKHIKKFGF